MKKTISILLALVLTVCFVPFAFAATLGDVDGDGSFTSADARKALRAAVGLEHFTDAEKARADVDSDGEVTAADARTILRASVGLSLLSEDGTYFEDAATPAQLLGKYIYQNGEETGYRTYVISYTTENEDGSQVSSYYVYTKTKTWPEPFASIITVSDEGTVVECQVWFNDTFNAYRVYYFIYEDGSEVSLLEAEYTLAYSTLSEATAANSLTTVSFDSDLEFTASEREELRQYAGQMAYLSLISLVYELEDANVGIDYRQNMHLYHIKDQ